MDGKIVGAVGVSGASSAAQDEELALYGAEAALSFGAASTSETVHIESHRVESAFVKGAPLLKVSDFKIHGGTTRRLAKGNVIVIPAGTPHWFKEVPVPFNYYVVKVIFKGGF
jgi:glc operon protein GlcG